MDISVRERGPGIPRELGGCLKGATQSTPGTAGEQGLGLGGSEAIVHLHSADRRAPG